MDEEALILTPEHREKFKRAMAVYDALKETTRLSLVSIAGIVSEDEGTFQGTGTIVELKGQILLVTAEHVVSQIETAGYKGVAFSNGNAKSYARAPYPFTKSRDLDVAFVRIPRPEQPDSDRVPCPEHLIATSAAGVENDLLFIRGFPGKFSRFFKISQGIVSETLPFGSGPGTPKWPHFDPSVHFAIDYDPKNNEASDGSFADLPDPHGLSGAVVWNTRKAELREKWTPNDARIAGIVQRWDQDGQCLIATKIEKIFPFLVSG